MLILKLTSKIKTGYWKATGLFSNSNGVEWPAELLIKEVEGGMVLDLDDKIYPSTMDGRAVLRLIPVHKVIELKPKKGLEFEVSKDILTHFNIKK